MLVLSRKKGQSIVIQDAIEVTVLEIEGDTIKLGVQAPKNVPVLRKELLESVLETNREAAEGGLALRQLAEQLKKIQKNDGKC